MATNNSAILDNWSSTPKKLGPPLDHLEDIGT